jgi:hypothetical protein
MPTWQQRNWDHSSVSSPQDQRRKLIRDYLALEDIPPEWDATGREKSGWEIQPLSRQPTEEEITTILEPWRPSRWRQAASNIWKHRFDEDIWLRTYYGDDSDAAFKGWREIHEDYDPAFEEDTVSWCVLDDPEVFNLGDKWDEVFDILPELAGPTQGYKRGRGFLKSDEVQKLRATIQAAEDKESEAESGAGRELQVNVVQTFLIVADQVAWNTGRLRLLYLDPQGNIVRQSKMRPEEVWQTCYQWIGKKFRDNNFWIDEFELNTWDESTWHRNYPGATLGDKYRAHGSLGRVLYGLG